MTTQSANREFIVTVQLVDKHWREVQKVNARAEILDLAIDKAIRWTAARIWDAQDFEKDYETACKEYPDLAHCMSRNDFIDQFGWLQKRLEATCVEAIAEGQSHFDLCYSYHGIASVIIAVFAPSSKKAKAALAKS